MFFWGSYNFQVTQQAENPGRPPVRYPVYLPPTPSLVEAKLCVTAATDSTASPSPLQPAEVAQFIRSCEATHHVGSSSAHDGDAELAQTLITLADKRLAVSTVACGAKHMVAVITGPDSSSVVGLGSNHSGQLGSAVATYANTLTDLRIGDVLEGRVTSVACGAKHTLLCTETGCVYVCGDNSFGQLGLPAPLGTKTQAGLNGGAPCCPHFAQLTSLVHVSKVFATQNASFALDQRGKLYSWGDAQYGHLGHNSRGEALDPDTLKIVTENVRSPQLVQWFQQQHVRLVEVAVGKSHLVCRSEDDVYTCGDGAYGKLGSGSATLSLEPVKVVFPERKQTEKLVSIAAGDDHTLVLKENPVIGSVVYFFGKLSNADGQLRPTIVAIPGAHDVLLTRVFAGKGTQCACVSADGQLFVWGKHSYPKVYNGSNATASRATPTEVEVLRGVPLTGWAAGGTFCVAYAGESGVRVEAEAAQGTATDEEADEGNAPVSRALSARLHPWSITVPQDARVSAHSPDGDVEEEYERGRAALLNLYLGERTGAAYVATLPPTPEKTADARYSYVKLGGAGLSVGQKVRLWMTDVYALATVVRVGDAPAAPLLSQPPASTSVTPLASRGASQAPPTLSPRPTQSQRTAQTNSPLRSGATSVKREDGGEGAKPSAVDEEAESHKGTHVRIEWQRDDWDEESLSLFSDDETLDGEKDNRWQPFWFEQGVDGNYIAPHAHK